jgi:hypothetical protein
MIALFACFDVRNLLIFLRVFCLCRMAKKNEKHLDMDPCDKDDSEEEEAGQNITPKPAKKTTTKTKNSAEKAAQKAAEMERNQAIYEKAAASLPPEEQKAF